MSKYLILNFRNAKLFQNKKTKDKIFEVSSGVVRDRSEEKFFKEPITVYQISNVLHALFGERPVPSLRGVAYARNEYYFQKANQSFLFLDVYKQRAKDGTERYVQEKMTTKKAVYNSWNNSVVLNWEIVRRYMDDNFDWFVGRVSELIQVEDPTAIPFHDVRNMILELDTFYIDVIKNELREKKLTLMNYYIDSIDKASLVTSTPNKVAITVVNGIESAIILNGKIAVPVTNEDIDRLKNVSKGCVTILDGGLVWIDSIKGGHEILLDEYTPVSQISTERY